MLTNLWCNVCSRASVKPFRWRHILPSVFHVVPNARFCARKTAKSRLCWAARSCRPFPRSWRQTYFSVLPSAEIPLERPFEPLILEAKGGASKGRITCAGAIDEPLGLTWATGGGLSECILHLQFKQIWRFFNPAAVRHIQQLLDIAWEKKNYFSIISVFFPTKLLRSVTPSPNGIFSKWEPKRNASKRR